MLLLLPVPLATNNTPLAIQKPASSYAARLAENESCNQLRTAQKERNFRGVFDTEEESLDLVEIRSVWLKICSNQIIPIIQTSPAITADSEQFFEKVATHSQRGSKVVKGRNQASGGIL